MKRTVTTRSIYWSGCHYFINMVTFVNQKSVVSPFWSTFDGTLTRPKVTLQTRCPPVAGCTLRLFPIREPPVLRLAIGMISGVFSWISSLLVKIVISRYWCPRYDNIVVVSTSSLWYCIPRGARYVQSLILMVSTSSDIDIERDIDGERIDGIYVQSLILMVSTSYIVMVSTSSLWYCIPRGAYHVQSRVVHTTSSLWYCIPRGARYVSIRPNQMMRNSRMRDDQ